LDSTGSYFGFIKDVDGNDAGRNELEDQGMDNTLIEFVGGSCEDLGFVVA
jgi:hypothetical protein